MKSYLTSKNVMIVAMTCFFSGIALFFFYTIWLHTWYPDGNYHYFHYFTRTLILGGSFLFFLALALYVTDDPFADRTEGNDT
ncbi:hypothetical protein FBY14_12441 [Azospirillum brasilense]|nr:hypothetical protein FBY14_12441 [Azospirillum brasilense]